MIRVLGIDVGPELCGVALVEVAPVGRSRLVWGKAVAWGEAAAEARAAALVAIECPEDVHQGIVRLRGVAALRSSSQHIGDCKRIAGRLEGMMMALGIAHETTTARDVRKSLFSLPTAGDAEVKTGLPIWCDGIGRTNNHVRDAIAVAIWLGRKAKR